MEDLENESPAREFRLVSAPVSTPTDSEGSISCNGLFVFSSLKSSLRKESCLPSPSAPMYDVAAFCLLACYAYKKLAMASVRRRMIPKHSCKALK